MRYFRRLSLFIWHLFSDLPPVSPATLTLSVAFLASWVFLSLTQIPENLAFVVSAVFAFSAQIWMRLPFAFRRAIRDGERPKTAIIVIVMATLVVCAVQLYVAEPRFSQRTFSVICAMYAAGTAWASWDRDLMDGLMPVKDGRQSFVALRRHLLQLRVLTAIVVLAVNETPMAIQASLGATVITLSALPLVLHYAYIVTLRLTFPTEDEDGA